jgi:hypothetical protein
MRRIIAGILIVVGFGFILAWLWFTYFYLGILPTFPHPESGNVIPLHVHGSVAYLTRSQNFLLLSLQIAAVISGAAGGLLLQSSRRGSGNRG